MKNVKFSLKRPIFDQFPLTTNARISAKLLIKNLSVLNYLMNTSCLFHRTWPIVFIKGFVLENHRDYLLVEFKKSLPTIFFW